MVDFWEKKRQELQREGKLPQARPEPVRTASGPWWAEGSTLVPSQPQVPQSASQPHTEGTEGRDFSKAMHLRSKEGNCPMCGSTEFMKPNAMAATRCFACGYVQGREVNDLAVFSVASPDATTVKVRQIESAHGVRTGHSAAEINLANASLESSAQGKASIN